MFINNINLISAAVRLDHDIIIHLFPDIIHTDRSRLLMNHTEWIPEKFAFITLKDTENNTGLQFNIALNYGGRDEIRRAVQAISEKVQCGELAPEDITDEMISDELTTGKLHADVPDPELIIRTSGELRLSNFLLWQSAYSELVFPQVMWPDFTPEEYEKAIVDYQSRERRFGGR